MSNAINKLKYFIGIQDLDEEEMYDDYYEDDYDTEVSSKLVKSKKANNKVINMHTNASMKIVVHEPLSYDEAPGIIDDLKARKTVVVNLEQLEIGIKKQIFDFVNGGIYAMEGNIQKVTKDIFIFAPDTVEIDGLKDQIKNKGIFSW